jgi:hypothetical protein
MPVQSHLRFARGLLTFGGPMLLAVACSGRSAPSMTRFVSVAPWEATVANTPPLGRGYVPAWDVKPARPVVMAVPAPKLVIDALSFRPPEHNPGSVNGDRPERPTDPVPTDPMKGGDHAAR